MGVHGVWQDGGTVEPPLTRYRPFFAGPSWLVTCHARGRQPALQSAAAVHLWQESWLSMRRTHAFRLHAYVTLPDHGHLLLVPAAGVPVDRLVRGAIERFERNFCVVMGVPSGPPVWHRQPRLDRMAAVEDFAAALDYIHYNPVQHGWADRPEAWPESSFALWVERRLYKLGWGWQPPARIVRKRWE